jgi:hypothetical protein
MTPFIAALYLEIVLKHNIYEIYLEIKLNLKKKLQRLNPDSCHRREQNPDRLTPEFTPPPNAVPT